MRFREIYLIAVVLVAGKATGEHGVLVGLALLAIFAGPVLVWTLVRAAIERTRGGAR